MPRPELASIQAAMLKEAFVEKGSAVGATATATKAALAGHRHYIVQVDASYSDSTKSGLLQVKSGAAVVAEKYVHGSGAFDFAPIGLDAENANEAVSAELEGVAATTGKITLMGFSVSE